MVPQLRRPISQKYVPCKAKKKSAIKACIPHRRTCLACSPCTKCVHTLLYIARYVLIKPTSRRTPPPPSPSSSSSPWPWSSSALPFCNFHQEPAACYRRHPFWKKACSAHGGATTATTPFPRTHGATAAFFFFIQKTRGTTKATNQTLNLAVATGEELSRSPVSRSARWLPDPLFRRGAARGVFRNESVKKNKNDCLNVSVGRELRVEKHSSSGRVCR